MSSHVGSCHFYISLIRGANDPQVVWFYPGFSLRVSHPRLSSFRTQHRPDPFPTLSWFLLHTHHLIYLLRSTVLHDLDTPIAILALDSQPTIFSLNPPFARQRFDPESSTNNNRLRRRKKKERCHVRERDDQWPLGGQSEVRMIVLLPRSFSRFSQFPPMYEWAEFGPILSRTPYIRTSVRILVWFRQTARARGTSMGGWMDGKRVQYDGPGWWFVAQGSRCSVHRRHAWSDARTIHSPSPVLSRHHCGSLIILEGSKFAGWEAQEEASNPSAVCG